MKPSQNYTVLMNVHYLEYDYRGKPLFFTIHFTISMIIWYSASVIRDSLLACDEVAPCPERQ